MANRFPLIVDANDSNIKEIPEGDSLDFTGVGIANLNNITLSGNLSANTATLSGALTAVGITSTGAIVGTTATLSGSMTADSATITNTIDAGNYTVGGAALSSIQVKSDWNETDSNDPAFIRNKPVISGIDRLADVPDVFADYPSDGSVENKILKWDGFSWQGVDEGSSGGVDLTAFSVNTNPASGSGSLTYNNGTGVFTFTPAIIPTSTSQLTNDGATGAPFITLTDVTGQGYITRTSLSAGDPIVYNNSTGVFTFDNTNTQYTTLGQVLIAVDLDAVLTAGAISSASATFGAINAAGASTLDDLTVTDLTMLTDMTSTNGDITLTNGSITLTNGNVSSGGNITGVNLSVSGTVSTSTVSNSGDIDIEAGNGNRVTIDNYLRITPDASAPSSPQVGDMWMTNEAGYYYSGSADGLGNGGWLQFPAADGTRGLQVPYFTTTERNGISSPRAGELILNITVGQLEIYNGSNWVTIGQ